MLLQAKKPDPSEKENPDQAFAFQEALRQRLAAEALVKGMLHLQIFDEAGVLLDSVPLDLSGFDGKSPKKIRTRKVELISRPVSVRIGP